MADGRHIDAARGHIGRDQDLQLAVAKALQHAVTAPLRVAAVQRSHVVPHVGEAVGEPVGIALGAREHQGLLHLLLGQDVIEQRVLVVHVVGPQQALLDVLVRVGVRRHVDALRIAQQVLRKATDVAEEGRAEHHRLARSRNGVGDRVDVVDEAHVEHAVGFVEHQHVDVLEHRLAGVEVVEQPAGGRDQDVELAAQRSDLCRVRHAAYDGGNSQARHEAAVGRGGLGDLHCEFARRAQHKHARAVDHAAFALDVGVGARGEHALQRGQDERCGLAAAGAGRNHQVGAFKCWRNRLQLHFGGGFVAGGGNGFGQGFIQAQGVKTHGLLSSSNTYAHMPPKGEKHATTHQPPRQCGDSKVAGEKVRINAGEALGLGNSQSDGIAANHSRKRWRAAWVRTERNAAGWLVARRRDEVRGDERNAGTGKSDFRRSAILCQAGFSRN